jgi:hypothetical protein
MTHRTEQYEFSVTMQNIFHIKNVSARMNFVYVCSYNELFLTITLALVLILIKSSTDILSVGIIVHVVILVCNIFYMLVINMFLFFRVMDKTGF